MGSTKTPAGWPAKTAAAAQGETKMSLGSFFGKVWAEFKKLFGKEPQVAQVVRSVITYVAPVLETVVTLAAGSAAGTIVTNVINNVQADLATVSTVIQQGTVAPGSTAEASIIAALNSVKSNLGTLLTDADVKNSAKAAEITSATNLIIGEVEAALTNLVPTSTTPAPAPTAAA
jgi:hypothetical protein